jgi:hypothetical protein
MPKNNVSDPITDQEIAFARLVLSGTMTDRRAAGAVGLPPDSAAYTISKPRVRAYMLEHRAAVQQQFVEQDTEELRWFNLSRDQILARLWEIANLDPEMTRGSASAQVKALSMIVAIEGLIPDRLSARRAVSLQNIPASPPIHAEFHTAAWRPTNVENVDPQPPSAAQQKDDTQLQSVPDGVDDPPRPTPEPTHDLSQSAFIARPLNPSQTTSSLPRVPIDYFALDTRAPFSIPENPFARRR